MSCRRFRLVNIATDCIHKNEQLWAALLSRRQNGYSICDLAHLESLGNLGIHRVVSLLLVDRPRSIWTGDEEIDSTPFRTIVFRALQPAPIHCNLFGNERSLTMILLNPAARDRLIPPHSEQVDRPRSIWTGDEIDSTP